MSDPIVQDIQTMVRAAAIVQQSLDDYENCCSNDKVERAQKLREVAHDALDAYMDAVASAHKRINDG